MKRKIIRLAILSILLTTLFSILMAFNYNKFKAFNTEIVSNAPKTLEELNRASIEELVKLPKFDSRNYNIVTPVRFQRNPVCWAYTAMAGSEINILKNKLTNKSNNDLDLNELYFAQNAFSRDTHRDKLELTYNDVYDIPWNNAQDPYKAAISLTQWYTPIEEYGNNKPIAKLVDLVNITDSSSKETAVTDIKYAVAKWGAVGFSYQIDERKAHKYYNQTSNLSGGHASTIVGWDDSISKDKFYPDSAKQDGAFIVKNSWGTGSHDGGYYYLSYDFSIIGKYAYNFVANDTYDNMYYYDGTYNSDTSPYATKRTRAAQIFPVLRDLSDKDEFLKAVNVAFIGRDVDVKVKIYNNVSANPGNPSSELNKPESGTLVAEGNAHFKFSGFRKVDLNNEVKLNKGEYFSIVVEISNPTKDAYIYFTDEKSRNDLSYFYDENEKEYKSALDYGMVARIRAYTKNKTKTETVNKNDLKYSRVFLNREEFRFIHDGNIKPIPKVIINSKLLRKDVDYRVEYKEEIFKPTTHQFDNFMKVGYVEVKVIGKGDYTGEQKAYAHIITAMKPDYSKINARYDYSANTLYIKSNSQDKNYQNINIENQGFVWVSNGNSMAIDYRGQYQDMIRNTYAGNVVILSANEEFPNTVPYTDFGLNTREYDPFVNIDTDPNLYVSNISQYIPNKNNIDSVTVEIQNKDNLYYTGGQIRPDIVVRYENSIVDTTNYNIEYSSNIEAGTASITITGINDFEGTKIVNFIIKKVNNEISNFRLENNMPYASAKFGEVKFEYFNNLGEKLSSRPTNDGEYQVRAVSKETNNYISNTTDKLSFSIHTEKRILPYFIKVKRLYNREFVSLFPEVSVYESNGNLVKTDYYYNNTEFIKIDLDYNKNYYVKITNLPNGYEVFDKYKLNYNTQNKHNFSGVDYDLTEIYIKANFLPKNTHINKNYELGEVFKETTFIDAKGVTHNIKDGTENGKGVIIGVFATWCPHSRKELDIINNIAEQLKDKVNVYFFIRDNDDVNDPNIDYKLSAFQDGYPPIIFSKDTTISNQFKKEGFPRTIYIDNEGVITDILGGAIGGEHILNLVNKIHISSANPDENKNNINDFEEIKILNNKINDLNIKIEEYNNSAKGIINQNMLSELEEKYNNLLKEKIETENSKNNIPEFKKSLVVAIKDISSKPVINDENNNNIKDIDELQALNSKIEQLNYNIEEYNSKLKGAISKDKYNELKGKRNELLSRKNNLLLEQNNLPNSKKSLLISVKNVNELTKVNDYNNNNIIDAEEFNEINKELTELKELVNEYNNAVDSKSEVNQSEFDKLKADYDSINTKKTALLNKISSLFTLSGNHSNDKDTLERQVETLNIANLPKVKNNNEDITINENQNNNEDTTIIENKENNDTNIDDQITNNKNDKNNSKTDNTNKNNTMLIILIVVIASIILALFVTIYLIKRKNNKKIKKVKN